MEIIKILDELRRIPTLSGFEDKGMEEVKKLLAPYFDESKRVGVNCLLFTKKCGEKKAKKVLIDAHLDEIGLIVTEVEKSGFLRVSKLGGTDPRTYTASRYTVHADKDLDAVAVRKPYLPKKDRKLPTFDTFRLFTGLTKEELTAAGVRVGTPVSMERSTEKIGEDGYFGAYMDDKSCAAAGLLAVDMLKDKKLSCDICLLLSSEEESYGAGFPTGAFAADPDEVLVVDVDLGNTPETDESKTVKMGEGPSVAISVQTDRQMTKDLLRIAKEKEIPAQPAMNVRSTGTNAWEMPFFKDGVPCAVIGLPLKYMHTTVETLYQKDLENTAKLIAAYIEEHYAEGGETK